MMSEDTQNQCVKCNTIWYGPEDTVCIDCERDVTYCMTVGELRKALAGHSEDTKVFITDSEYAETCATLESVGADDVYESDLKFLMGDPVHEDSDDTLVEENAVILVAKDYYI